METNNEVLAKKFILSILALVLISLPSFYTGLFFQEEMGVHQYLVSAACLLLLIVIILGRNGRKQDGTVNKPDRWFSDMPVQPLVKSPYFLALLVMTGSYGLSFFQAVNAKAGLFLWLRHIDYLLSFVLVFIAISIWEKDGKAVFVRQALTVFAVTGTAIAAWGILSAQGIGPALIDSVTTSGRLGSTFQYPNSLAAYLMATFLMTIHLGMQKNRSLMAGVFAGMGFLSFLAIVGTQSRGVWVMLPIILIVFIIGQRDRRDSILLTTIILGLAIIHSSLTVSQQAQQTHPNWIAFFYTLAGFFASGFGWGGWVLLAKIANQSATWQSYKKDMFNKKTMFSKIKGLIAAILKSSGQKKKTVLLCLVFSMLFITETVVVLNQTGTTYPASSTAGAPMTRLSQIDPGENSLRLRLVFYSDALKMIKERPLLGWGGGGWENGYQAFQSINYLATEAHNHFLQVWIESGTLGFTAFTLPFLFICSGLLRLYGMIKTNTLAAETWTVGVSALALGLHSIIDFNLSFGSISLLLWALFALFAYREWVMGFGILPFRRRGFNQAARKNHAGEKRNSFLTVLVIVSITMASIHLAINTYVLRTAESRAQKFTMAVQMGETEAANGHIEAASRLDRWEAKYPIMHAQFLITSIMQNEGPQDQKVLIGQSLKLVQQGVKLDSCNQDYHFLLSWLYYANGRLEDAMAGAERALLLKPWFVETYEEFSEIYLNVAIKKLLLGQKESARYALRRVLDVTQYAVGKKDTLPPRLKGLWNNRWDLTLTPPLALNAGKAAFLLEDYNLARDYLARAIQADDEKMKVSAQLWLGAALQKLGDLSGAALLESARQTGLYADNEYEIVKQLMIK